MPSEERFINFNLDEIHKAIAIGCIKEGKRALPDGSLSHIEIDEEPNASQDTIYLNFDVANGGKEKVEFSRKFFALSLVFFCQGSGIPIPARGQKVLKIKSDSITMAIMLDRKNLID